MIEANRKYVQVDLKIFVVMLDEIWWMLWLVLYDTLNIMSLFLLILEYAEIISDFIVLQICNLPGIRMYNDFYSLKVYFIDIHRYYIPYKRI